MNKLKSPAILTFVVIILLCFVIIGIYGLFITPAQEIKNKEYKIKEYKIPKPYHLIYFPLQNKYGIASIGLNNNDSIILFLKTETEYNYLLRTNLDNPFFISPFDNSYLSNYIYTLDSSVINISLFDDSLGAKRLLKKFLDSSYFQENKFNYKIIE